MQQKARPVTQTSKQHVIKGIGKKLSKMLNNEIQWPGKTPLKQEYVQNILFNCIFSFLMQMVTYHTSLFKS